MKFKIGEPVLFQQRATLGLMFVLFADDRSETYWIRKGLQEGMHFCATDDLLHRLVMSFVGPIDVEEV